MAVKIGFPDKYPESHFSKHYYFKLLSFQATIVQINVIRRGGFAAPRRKMTKNRLRFGRHFSFFSDFLSVRLAAQEIQVSQGDASKGFPLRLSARRRGFAPSRSAYGASYINLRP